MFRIHLKVLFEGKGSRNKFWTSISKAKESETSSGLPYRRQGNPKTSSGLPYRRKLKTWTPIRRFSHTKARESKNEFQAPISKVKETENEFGLPYQSFGTPRFPKWGRWASLNEPDLEIFSGFRRFTASGWNFEDPEILCQTFRK
ncbi:uncharacterized protein OCT59_026838 [Rhizophagus irregularis]|uniref:uncharacterized protein n=1 Tax=Rhizophagus irregularis TaxID=588596 RepID=UPI0033166198|nr:hypothetical protein OCT59_026838 [Rhizophagus irregularis]